MVAKVTSYAEVYGKKITLHNGEVFDTKAEHDAYVRGVKHATASLDIALDNLEHNAEVIKYEDDIFG